MSQDFSLTFKLTPHGNDSFIGEIINGTGSKKSADYDHEGAVYYVLAVVFMFGCSILLMIGSSMKKSKHDNEFTAYMKGLERLGKMELKQEKFRTKLQMQQIKVIMITISRSCMS